MGSHCYRSHAESCVLSPSPRAWANADSVLYSEHHEVYHLGIRHPCPEVGCHRMYTYRRDLLRHIRRDHTKATHEKEMPRANGFKRSGGARPVVPSQTRPRAQGRSQTMDAHQIPHQRGSPGQQPQPGYRAYPPPPSAQKGSRSQRGITSQLPRQLNNVLNHGTMSPPVAPAYYTDSLLAVPTDPTGEIWPAS